MNTKTETRTVQCEKGKLTYFLTRKSVKNINLKIKADGQIFVSANDKVSGELVDNFVVQKQNYIYATLDNYEEKSSYSSQSIRKYVSGEQFDILGQTMSLRVEESKQEEVFMDGLDIVLRVRNVNNSHRKEGMMKQWQREYELNIFRQICDELHQRLKKYNVPYPMIIIKKMTSGWGACQPRQGSITLNNRLIEAPRYCIEYEILHELIHFIYPVHSVDFWDFVSILMPDWKRREEELERLWR